MNNNNINEINKEKIKTIIDRSLKIINEREENNKITKKEVINKIIAIIEDVVKNEN